MHNTSGVVADRSIDRSDRRVGAVQVGAHTVPTVAPECDGTLRWGATTIIVVGGMA